MSKSNRVRAWVFTLNNPERQLDLKGKCKYAVWQLEKGEEGTEHYQGYIEFSTKKSMKQVKTILGTRVHLEVRKGTAQQARDYCMKEEGRVSGPWEEGKYLGRGRRTDLENIAQKLRKRKLEEVAEEEPGMYIRYHRGLKALKTVYNKTERGNGWIKPEIHVFWGDTGAGKTKDAYQMDPDLYCLTIPTGGIVWFDGYDNHETILIDEFYGQIKYSFMLRLLDGYPMDVQYKGGFLRLNHKRIIITSNEEPSEWYKNVEKQDALHRRLREFATIKYYSSYP